MRTDYFNGKPRRIDQPEPGCFQMKLVRGGPFIAARIHHENGLWWAVINGKAGAKASDPVNAPGVFTVWTSGRQIPEREYAQCKPVAAPDKPIDILNSPPPY